MTKTNAFSARMPMVSDIRKLSPGTRGIVLLLLYLAIDDQDDRPLIIDQPEENLVKSREGRKYRINIFIHDDNVDDQSFESHRRWFGSHDFFVRHNRCQLKCRCI